MDYEKKYKEALEKARQLCVYPTTKPFISDLQDIFPELKESRDERIRKSLFDYLHTLPNHFSHNGGLVTDWIAWLEKQGEHSIYNVPSREVILAIWDLGNEWKELTNGSISTEHGTQLDYIQKHWHESEYYLKEKQGESESSSKVKPKFHKDEWITNGDYTWKIVEVKPLDYILQSQDGNIVDDTISHVDEQFHPFTIEDAKDGDVLTCYSDIKRQPIEQTGIIKQYVGRHGGCSNCFEAYIGVDWDGNIITDGYMGSSNIYPATKSQRDTLEKAMADAGYIFDFEKKELKKIEQKSAWGEEDSEHLYSIINSYKDLIADYKASHDVDYIPYNSNTVVRTVINDVNFLESLKERYTWKPSEGQMDALDYYANSLCTYCDRQDDLRSLFNDLKKL